MLGYSILTTNSYRRYINHISDTKATTSLALCQLSLSTWRRNTTLGTIQPYVSSALRFLYTSFCIPSIPIRTHWRYAHLHEDQGCTRVVATPRKESPWPKSVCCEGRSPGASVVAAERVLDLDVSALLECCRLVLLFWSLIGGDVVYTPGHPVFECSMAIFFVRYLFLKQPIQIYILQPELDSYPARGCPPAVSFCCWLWPNRERSTSCLRGWPAQQRLFVIMRGNARN